MRVFCIITTTGFYLSGCISSASSEQLISVNRNKVYIASAHIQQQDTIKSTGKAYDQIEFEKVEVLNAAPGTKSVLFNSRGTHLYAMNLEGMSIYEFNQTTRKVEREFKFKPTKGTGWDYETDKPIPSFQEKPVEACLSHEDRFLWVSLHNAEGIVPIRLDTIFKFHPVKDSHPVKKIYVRNTGQNSRDSFNVPLIETGKTPKVISRTADNKFLLVSNWHSCTVSVLEMDTANYPYAKLKRSLPVAAIPRGVTVDDKRNKSYVAIMGGASIAVINNTDWTYKEDIHVASNPRHVVMDSSSRLFVSYNRLGKIACVDAMTGNTLFTAPTHRQPRTIMLSKNQQFLFVTCYSSDTVDVFKINESNFSKVISLPCKGHPVGVDIFEDDNKLEAWVCSYTNGAINIYTFRKRRSSRAK